MNSLMKRAAALGLAAVLMLASFLGGMVPPLVGLGLARGALASRIR